MTLKEYINERKIQGTNVKTSSNEAVWVGLEGFEQMVYLDGILTSEDLRMIADYLDKKKEK